MNKNIIIFILAIALMFVSIYCFYLLSKNFDDSKENIETERKFLIALKDLPADIETRGDVFRFVQTYINYSPEMRVRKVNEIYHYFTIKLPKDDIGLSREEIEKLITEEEYNELAQKQIGKVIHKTRYQFYEGSNLVAVDIYSHELTGLAVAEVEFENVEKSEKFNPPSWFGKEITSDMRYKNANLSRDGMPNVDSAELKLN